MTVLRRPRPKVAGALMAALALLPVLAGCSGSLPKTVGSAPVLSVVTGLYPLAVAAEMVGGDKVAVDDLVPAGTDPLAFQPTAQESLTIRSAGLVLEAGGG